MVKAVEVAETPTKRTASKPAARVQPTIKTKPIAVKKPMTDVRKFEEDFKAFLAEFKNQDVDTNYVKYEGDVGNTLIAWMYGPSLNVIENLIESFKPVMAEKGVRLRGVKAYCSAYCNMAWRVMLQPEA